MTDTGPTTCGWNDYANRCVKPGCGQQGKRVEALCRGEPRSDMHASPLNEVETLAAEVEGLVATSGALALAYVIVDRDGGVRLRQAFIPGGRLALLAGLDLSKDQLKDMIKLDPEPPPENKA